MNENGTIPEKYLDHLRSAGLFVSDPIGAFNAGRYIVKPTSTKGNFIVDYTDGFCQGDVSETPCPATDAPMLRFMTDQTVWQVNGNDSAGGLGPADFINDWDTPEQAVQDILNFFFGDPSRMNAKADHYKKEMGVRSGPNLR